MITGRSERNAKEKIRPYCQAASRSPSFFSAPAPGRRSWQVDAMCAQQSVHVPKPFNMNKKQHTIQTTWHSLDVFEARMYYCNTWQMTDVARKRVHGRGCKMDKFDRSMDESSSNEEDLRRSSKFHLVPRYRGVVEHPLLCSEAACIHCLLACLCVRACLLACLLAAGLLARWLAGSVACWLGGLLAGTHACMHACMHVCYVSVWMQFGMDGSMIARLHNVCLCLRERMHSGTCVRVHTCLESRKNSYAWPMAHTTYSGRISMSGQNLEIIQL